jgi:cell division transport system permease protein
MSTSGTHNIRTFMSWLSTSISIAMVIYVVGLMGYLLLKGKTISEKSKESFVYEIYLKDGIKDIDIIQFKKTLDAESFVVKTVYKDKDQAYAEYKSSIDPNENFLMTLGENPLPENIDVYFISEYSHPDSLRDFEAKIKSSPLVSDFRYPSDLLYLVHQNLNKIAYALLSVSLLLMFVAIALINNTIRLRVYSQRFMIRTMQLIGAKNSFIRAPFLWKSLFLGAVSGFLAIFGLIGSLTLMYDYWPEAAALISFKSDLKLYVGMLVLSVIITYLSTGIAVNRFLRLRTEKLYY